MFFIFFRAFANFCPFNLLWEPWPSLHGKVLCSATWRQIQRASSPHLQRADWADGKFKTGTEATWGWKIYKNRHLVWPKDAKKADWAPLHRSIKSILILYYNLYILCPSCIHELPCESNLHHVRRLHHSCLAPKRQCPTQMRSWRHPEALT